MRANVHCRVTRSMSVTMSMIGLLDFREENPNERRGLPVETILERALGRWRQAPRRRRAAVQ